MAFFTRQDIGRIYVIRMELPGDTVVHKVGMCKSSRSTDRMMEILRSWFTRYRFVPYTQLRLDMETGFPLELEAHIHKMLGHCRFIPTEKVDGGTEMFTDVDEVRLLHYLRSFDERQFPLDLTDDDYEKLGKWLAPDVERT